MVYGDASPQGKAMLQSITATLLIAGVVLIGVGAYLTVRQAPITGSKASEGMTGLVKAPA